jgi:hypothetical protein
MAQGYVLTERITDVRDLIDKYRRADESPLYGIFTSLEAAEAAKAHLAQTSNNVVLTVVPVELDSLGLGLRGRWLATVSRQSGHLYVTPLYWDAADASLEDTEPQIGTEVICVHSYVSENDARDRAMQAHQQHPYVKTLYVLEGSPAIGDDGNPIRGIYASRSAAEAALAQLQAWGMTALPTIEEYALGQTSGLPPCFRVQLSLSTGNVFNQTCVWDIATPAYQIASEIVVATSTVSAADALSQAQQYRQAWLASQPTQA